MEIDYISLLSALGVIALGLLQWRSTVRSVRSDSNAVDIKTFHDQIETVQRLSADMLKINQRITDMEKKNSVLWHYVYELLEFIIGRGMNPPPPPVELESDPKLTRIINKVRT